MAIVANIKKHAAYIASTIGYMSDQIKENVDILRTAEVGLVLLGDGPLNMVTDCFSLQERMGPEELMAHTEDALQNTISMHEELSLLSTRLARVSDIILNLFSS